MVKRLIEKKTKKYWMFERKNKYSAHFKRFTRIKFVFSEFYGRRFHHLINAICFKLE